jgi:hypothetical protein
VTTTALHAQALAALAAQTNLQVFDGAPDDGRPSLGYGAPARDVVMDGDGRAHMYAALYVGPGARNLEDERAAGIGGTRVVSFQVTAAGGDPNRANRAVDKVLAALEGKRVPGGGLIRADADPGPPRLDREPNPGRYFVPLLFRVSIQ